MAQNIKHLVEETGKKAKAAYIALSVASPSQKTLALKEAAKAMRRNAKSILKANELDLRIAKNAGKNAAYLDRLSLNEKRIDTMAKSVEVIANLPDPVGTVLKSWKRPNGLKISRVSVPLGVVGVIYESRPNVTADAGALCLKAGNAVILRCGSDSYNTSHEIEKALKAGLKKAKLPTSSIQLIASAEREAVTHMLSLTDYIDVIVPRGGRSLTEKVKNESKIATFLHLDGNCHTYIHAKANLKKALEVTFNAKMRRTGICGATETILVDGAIAKKFMPLLADKLSAAKCEMRGDDTSRKLDPRIKKATEDDWYTEYLDAIVAVKVIKNVGDAITHINKYGSHHTDAIITEDKSAAKNFMANVDSAIVLHNASTQFADGGEFGFGGEIGIATGRMHARGPVGVQQLTTFKYVVEGNGQIRPV